MLGLTGIVCSVGYILGDINGLLASLTFCSIPWAYEIQERRIKPLLVIGTCVICGHKFRIRTKMTSGERKICNLCINKIFRYSKTIPDME
ncbi:MAG: hypothetical protein Q8M97_03885 [Methanobacteriaceae archaeon]|nr:hypothetical protein [Methanobacteriaceae archaeon]MDP3624811.1 hypothetical protein [Methanobacteriaceae archaeon]